MNMTESDLVRMNNVLRHRLRNSASGLKASVTFLSKELSNTLSPSQMEYFPLILSECDAITHVTNRMQLLFDPVKPGQDSMFGTLVEQSLATVHAAFPTTSVVEDILPVLEQVVIGKSECLLIPLNELLVNAVEAGLAESITLTASLHDGMLSVAVRNKPPQYGYVDAEAGEQADPFLPFYTTKTRHLGLGLSIARKYAEEVRGEVTLERSSEECVAVIRLYVDPA